MKKQQKCYIYTRVSTSMQVDGYSLDAQKDKLKKYADYQEMSIVGEYSDEGKSGKSVESRPQFKQMLSDIENGKDNVDYVLVFKLSRFGRNAADVLSSLQKMQDYGVNLICVEDGIDSSKDAGKLMISVLSAVAEIERENILVQTMEGRRQKAREGRWNGGFAPYGYQLVNGELIIAEDEAEIIRIIYDKFANTTMGMAAIAAFLNNSGYKKKLRQNNTIEGFSTSFVKGVLDNPIYCGKLAFGRRKNEKIPGTRNEYHIVKQKDYLLSDGIHEAIISEEMWNQAHRKRQETGVLQVKTHSLEHEHILSGIIKCPVCGSGMYGNVNRKKHPDGGYYKDYFYYACKHRKLVDGHRCTYKRQWNEDRINAAVEKIIRKFVKNPKFEREIRKQIGSSIDTSELDRKYDGLKDRLSQTTGALLLCALVGIFVLTQAFGKRLSQFTADLCQTLDHMIAGNEAPQRPEDSETQLARIGHRLARLYQIMQENRRRVDEERQELQTLVSDISHQVKTPVSNLKMATDTLLEKPMAEAERTDFIRGIRSQTDKLDFLFQALVKTSRLETGVIQLDKKPGRLFDTVAQAMSGIVYAAEKKEIAVSVDCPEDLTVFHDSKWTSEALFNLLDNAVKYTPAGGKIAVSVVLWEMYVEIKVTDTGKGISESNQAAIFRRFYREEEVHEQQGVGIGLYLAREIVTRQGGYIKVISEPGKGSEFSIMLPTK